MLFAFLISYCLMVALLTLEFAMNIELEEVVGQDVSN